MARKFVTLLFHHHPSGHSAFSANSVIWVAFLAIASGDPHGEHVVLKSFRRLPGQSARHPAGVVFRAQFAIDFHADCLVATVNIVLTDRPSNCTD